MKLCHYLYSLLQFLGSDVNEVSNEETVNVNYFGLLRVSEALFPILNNNAVVINVSSSAGHLYRIPGTDKRRKIGKADLTISELNGLMKDYIQ